MADLKTEHKQLIVKELARFRPHSEIQKLLHVVFDIQVTLQQVYNFDPTKAANEKRIAKNLRELFDETRKAFIGNPDDHEISKQAYRIGRLQRMSEKAEALGNSALAADLIEQAAKDTGGQFTNRQKVEASVIGEMVTMSVAEWQHRADERRKQAEQTMAEFGEDEIEQTETPVTSMDKPMIPMFAVESSNIASIGYHEPSKTVAVLFNNAYLYHVSPVEQPTFTAFYGAPSKGKFYNENFKNVEGVTVTKIEQTAGDAGA